MIVKAKTSDGKNSVQVVGQSADVVIGCQQFQHWLDTFEYGPMDLRLVSIQSADIFDGGRVIFVKAETDVVDRANGKKIPGIVFLRGNAVTVLIFIECVETGEVYVLTVRQPRIPVGQYRFCELVAGMMDKKDGVVGRALAELWEEAHIRISKRDLRYLGVSVPSTGGCDEQINSFYAHKKLRRKKIDYLLSRSWGAEGENEQTLIRLQPIPEFVKSLATGDIIDGKALSTLMLLLLKQAPYTVTQLLKEAGKQKPRKRGRK